MVNEITKNISESINKRINDARGDMILMSDGEKNIAIPADTFDPKYANDEYIKDLVGNLADWIIYLNNNLATLGSEISSIKNKLNHNKEI